MWAGATAREGACSLLQVRAAVSGSSRNNADASNNDGEVASKDKNRVYRNRVGISELGLQVEDLGRGTLVNGYQRTEQVQLDYPADAQLGELSVGIEVKAAQPAAVSPTLSSMDITILQRAANKIKGSMEMNVSRRKHTRPPDLTPCGPGGKL